MDKAENPALSASELAELSALADGTLDPGRRQEVEERISASPELRERLERERRAVAALSAARDEVQAPGALRARLRQERPSRRQQARGRLRYGGALTAALAAVVLALVLILPGGTPGAPTVSQAAGLAALGATGPAPSLDTQSPGLLTAAVGSLHFPNWGSLPGWRVTGARVDTVSGRRMLTVYYRAYGRTIAYSILSSPVIAAPSKAGEPVGPYQIQAFRMGGRTIVTWRRDGHTCVLSGLGVSDRVLRSLVTTA